MRPIQNTFPFLGLHARARDTTHQSTEEGPSAPVHGHKKLHGEGTRTYTDGQTLRLLEQIGLVGRFVEKTIHQLSPLCKN